MCMDQIKDLLCYYYALLLGGLYVGEYMIGG